MSSTSRSDNPILLSWLTLAAILGTFVVNIWSNFAPLYGQTIGDISNTRFANVLIIPANYAFAIWGLIYLGLLGFGIYQLLPEQRQNPRLRSVRPLLILACIAQAIWVFSFLSQQFWLSVVFMLLILVPLLGCYLKLGVGKQPVGRAEKWLAQVPFGIYLGWISVATIVNVAIALYSQNWNGGGSAVFWTVVMMVIAGGLGGLLAVQRRELAYPLVIVWALIAIATRQSAIPPILITATILAIGLMVLVLMKLVGQLKHRRL